jgi:hypothetical protein
MRMIEPRAMGAQDHRTSRLEHTFDLAKIPVQIPDVLEHLERNSDVEHPSPSGTGRSGSMTTSASVSRSPPT